MTESFHDISDYSHSHIASRENSFYNSLSLDDTMSMQAAMPPPLSYWMMTSTDRPQFECYGPDDDLDLDFGFDSPEFSQMSGFLGSDGGFSISWDGKPKPAFEKTNKIPP